MNPTTAAGLIFVAGLVMSPHAHADDAATTGLHHVDGERRPRHAEPVHE